jgi:DNA-binding GntR family transcriptional regulator
MASAYRTMQEIAYDTIREAILSGRYKPGQRLLADDLAKELGVSRMPVREALHRLEVTGLISIVPHRGAVVNDLSETEIIEIYHIRAVLEGLASRLAISNLTAQDHCRMGDLLNEMDRFGQSQDVDQSLRLNHEFHTIIWTAAQSPRLLALLENLYDASQQYRYISMLLPGRLTQISHEHRQILGALIQRDAVAAEQFANEHHERTASRLLNSLERARND